MRAWYLRLLQVSRRRSPVSTLFTALHGLHDSTLARSLWISYWTSPFELPEDSRF